MPVLRRLALLVALLAAACSSSGGGTAATTTTTTTTTAGATAGAALDRSRLPLGDGRSSDGPRKGWVFSCRAPGGGGGAFRDGPWIDAGAGTWDATAKIAVQGSVDHHGQVSVGVAKSGTVVSGNGLPTAPTGVFPVAAGDPAYQYDRNPNTVRGSALDVTLPEPAVAAAPACVGGTIGVSVLGAPVYSAFDALGRDAAAHEVQDACGGHPERTGQYHYHALSPCWETAAGFDEGLFGYALDGFGIYVEDAATADLDECHGHTGEVVWRGRRVSMYHYVATPDFPYLVGCFRGTPVTSATGLHLRGP